MKKILFLFLLCFNISTSSAQKIKDSIVISIDTINIYGKVIDQKGEPVYNALILSETLDANWHYIQARTNKAGSFILNGVKPSDVIRVRTKELAVEQPLKGSRYLLVTLVPLNKLALNTSNTAFQLNAKRLSPKAKYTYKNIDTTFAVTFHPFGHYAPATYPGGLQKFYDFIGKNIVYPQIAVRNNIEGMVTVEFTIDGEGLCKDFLIVSDIGYGCGEEVLRVLKTAKKWNPAMNGLTVKQRVLLEIPFKLTE